MLHFLFLLKGKELLKKKIPSGEPSPSGGPKSNLASTTVTWRLSQLIHSEENNIQLANEPKEAPTQWKTNQTYL